MRCYRQLIKFETCIAYQNSSIAADAETAKESQHNAGCFVFGSLVIATGMS
jgi:hypothetical protein